MNRTAIVVALVLGALTLLTIVPRIRAADTAPVVVELFESQGCSSCPPSERVIEDLRRHFGPSIIVLVFHVHYWDYLGWKDPYSDARYTERQKMYASAFQQDSIYTPEMVVQGETGFIGSDFERATDEIDRRLQAGRLTLVLNVTEMESGAAEVTTQLPRDLAKQARAVTAVVYENAPPVQVLRGENAGATMSGEAAVRALIPMSVDASGRGSIVVPLQHPWNSARLSVAVLVRGDSPRILAARSASWNGKGI